MSITRPEFTAPGPIFLISDDMLAETFSKLNDPKEDKENIVNCRLVCKTWEKTLWRHPICKNLITSLFPEDFRPLNILISQFDQIESRCQQHHHTDEERVCDTFNQLSSETQTKLTFRLRKIEYNQNAALLRASGIGYSIGLEMESAHFTDSCQKNSPNCTTRKKVLHLILEENKLYAIGTWLQKNSVEKKPKCQILVQFSKLSKSTKMGVNNHLKDLITKEYPTFKNKFYPICFSNFKIPNDVKADAINNYLCHQFLSLD